MADTIQVYFIKFPISSQEEINEIVLPFNMGKFEVNVPKVLTKYNLVIGMVYDINTIEYLKDRLRLKGKELSQSNETEFETAKSLIGIDYWYIKG